MNHVIASSSVLEAILDKIEVYSGQKNFYSKTEEKIEKKEKSIVEHKNSFVEQEKEKVRQKIIERNKKSKKNLSGDGSIVDQHLNTLKQWKEEHKTTLQDWKNARETFYKNIHLYAKYSEDTSKDEKLLKEILRKNKKLFETEKVRDVSVTQPIVLKGAFKLPVKNQYARPTCSSFAGIRAIELLVFREGKEFDLSEQYFYWSSKPDCRKQNCSQIGSWVGYGLEFSQEKTGLNIPLESDCPYKPVSVNGNETQIPMQHECLNRGRVKVTKFSYSKDLSHVKDAIKKNSPVIAGVKLSHNFYKNEGLILFKDRNKNKVNLDHHSKGHAILIVGYIPFPTNLKDEGAGCFLVTNSWGIGWGQGGHACVSEKWLKYHKRMNPYVMIKGIKI